MNREFEQQLRDCDHVARYHDMLSNAMECLCGKTHVPVTPEHPCASTACLCRRLDKRPV